MKRFVIFVLVVVMAVGGVVTVKALTLPSRQVEPLEGVSIKLDEARAIENLQAAIRVQTISYDEPSRNVPEPFVELHRVLAERFPLVHAKLQPEVVGRQAMLFTWTGSDPSQKSLILIAHQDVVPAGDPAQWTHPPFDAVNADGYIWGRGTLDDKNSMVGLLEAVESLLAEGFVPKRTIYLGFGDDEEIGGNSGAAKIAETLAARKVQAELVLDEGMSVVQGMVPGIKGEVGVIGVAEKGYLSLDLKVKGEGGHSSEPPDETQIGILSAALARLEHHPMPFALDGLGLTTFEYLAPEMSFPLRAVFANLWLTRPLVSHQMKSNPTTNAMFRTTTAITMISAGEKENILPAEASAVVNMRLMPGVTIDAAVAHVKQALGDERVEVAVREGANEASPVSSTTAPGYVALSRLVRQQFSGAAITPGLVMGATDSRQYASVAENMYRFCPVSLTDDDLSRIHAVDERIEIKNYIRMIQVYGQLIRNLAS